MSKNGPNPSKTGPYPNKHVCLREMFHIENYLSLEKVIPMDKFANHYKINGFLNEAAYKYCYIVGFFPRLNKTCQYKNVILLNGITIHY